MQADPIMGVALGALLLAFPFLWSLTLQRALRVWGEYSTRKEIIRMDETTVPRKRRTKKATQEASATQAEALRKAICDMQAHLDTLEPSAPVPAPPACEVDDAEWYDLQPEPQPIQSLQPVLDGLAETRALLSQRPHWAMAFIPTGMFIGGFVTALVAMLLLRYT